MKPLKQDTNNKYLTSKPIYCNYQMKKEKKGSTRVPEVIEIDWKTTPISSLMTCDSSLRVALLRDRQCRVHELDGSHSFRNRSSRPLLSRARFLGIWLWLWSTVSLESLGRAPFLFSFSFWVWCLVLFYFVPVEFVWFLNLHSRIAYKVFMELCLVRSNIWFGWISEHIWLWIWLLCGTSNSRALFTVIESMQSWGKDCWNEV